jgi:polyferredoxin
LTAVKGFLNLSYSVKRKLAQLAAALLTNANVKGFAEGRIYSGKLKQFCAPGLNCYSCPGAIAACPLGALQIMFADPEYKMSFYVVGTLMALGLALGRFICGWLCPFGLLQEFIRKPFAAFAKNSKRQNSKRRNATYFLRYTKYAILIVMVILGPLFAVDRFGFGLPYFCEYFCPAGTIEAAAPLALANSSLRRLIGWVFWLKVGIAAAVVCMSAITNRFFCKYLCPLGAIYAAFNRISLIQLKYAPQKCCDCGICSIACPMDIDPRNVKAYSECIRCGKCSNVCPCGALTLFEKSGSTAVANK